MQSGWIGAWALLAMSATGCTWVTLAPEARSVRVLTQADAACVRRGEVEARVTHNVATLEREPLKVRDELETLARNQAPSLQGNAIQPIAAPRDGRQRFIVWQCPG